MILKDKIKSSLDNIDSIVLKDKPATFTLDGHDFEIRKNKLFVRYKNSSIMYKSKRGFSREKLERAINDAIDYFKRVEVKIRRRLKKKERNNAGRVY